MMARISVGPVAAPGRPGRAWPGPAGPPVRVLDLQLEAPAIDDDLDPPPAAVGQDQDATAAGRGRPVAPSGPAVRRDLAGDLPGRAGRARGPRSSRPPVDDVGSRRRSRHGDGAPPLSSRIGDRCVAGRRQPASTAASPAARTAAPRRRPARLGPSQCSPTQSVDRSPARKAGSRATRGGTAAWSGRRLTSTSSSARRRRSSAAARSGPTAMTLAIRGS